MTKHFHTRVYIPIYQTCMFLDSGRKQERPDKTHKKIRLTSLEATVGTSKLNKSTTVQTV